MQSKKHKKPQNTCKGKTLNLSQQKCSRPLGGALSTDCYSQGCEQNTYCVADGDVL